MRLWCIVNGLFVLLVIEDSAFNEHVTNVDVESLRNWIQEVFAVYDFLVRLLRRFKFLRFLKKNRLVQLYLKITINLVESFIRPIFNPAQNKKLFPFTTIKYDRW